MVDKAAAKRRERARIAAGYAHVSGYAKEQEAEAMQTKLLTAQEVDDAIGGGKDDT